MKGQKGLFKCWLCFLPAGSSVNRLVSPGSDLMGPKEHVRISRKLTLCIYQQFPYLLVMFWFLSLLDSLPQIHLVPSLTNAIVALTTSLAFNTLLYSHKEMLCVLPWRFKQELGKVSPGALSTHLLNHGSCSQPSQFCCHFINQSSQNTAHLCSTCLQTTCLGFLFCLICLRRTFWPHASLDFLYNHTQ